MNTFLNRFLDGEVADLEMQIGRSSDDLKTRAAAYAAMIQTGQTRRGKQYRQAKRAYQIFFLNCVLFPDSDKLPRRYGYREEQEGDLLTDAVEIMFYELPKLERQVKECLASKSLPPSLRDDEKWCIYMKWRHEKEAEPLIKELCRREEGIMRAEKSLVKVSRSYMKFAREFAIVTNEMEYNARLENAHKEGHTEGRAEGLEAVARKMKKSGRPLSEIAEFTGLPTETIEALDWE